MDSKQGKRETNRRGEIMLKAVFSRFGEEIELTDELWQYDFGQKIQVTGIELPDVCEVHFQYDNLTETKTVTGYKQEDALIIDIPNEALTSRGIIKLYIYLVSSEEGRTVNVAIMHVNRRMKPEGFEVPEDIDLFHHTLLAANEYMRQTKSAKNAAEAAKEEIQESADQIQKNATEIDSLKEDKITKPAEAPTIGKIIRVKSVNEDGTFVCEWADSASELDVRIDGKSIVQDGVAEIPKADTNTHNLGLIRVNAGNGFAVSADGTLNIIECTDDSLKKRYARIVSGNVIDYAVKAAMCDGKGTAWTADEQAAARERMGIGEWELVADIVLEEKVQKISFTIESWKELFVQIDAKAVQDTVSTTILYPFTNANFCDFYPGVGKDASIYVHMVKFDDYALYYELSFNNKSGNSGTPKSSIVKCSINRLYFTRDYFESGTTAKVWSR